MKKMNIKLIAGTCLLLTSGLAQAATANFDSFTEGSVGYTFTAGGITFSDFDNYISFYTPQFAIEEGTNSLAGSTFSPGNALSFTSPVSGPSMAFGRFGAMTMTAGEIGTSASVDIFATSASRNNQLTLNAYFQGNLVDSTSAYLQNFEAYANLNYQYTLSLDGIRFDELRLVSSGPDNSGASFIAVDNVVIATPIPPAAVLMGSGLLLLGSMRRKNTSARSQTA